MRRDQFEAELSQFSQSKAWNMGEREAPASLAELREYEAMVGFRLPAEYVNLVTSHGAGQFGFVEVFSVRDGEWNIEVQRMSAPGLPQHFVPVSDNGCGDFYGFKVEDGQCSSSLVFADHEQGYSLVDTEFSDLYEYVHRHGFNAA
jgi:hypothetical protein